MAERNGDVMRRRLIFSLFPVFAFASAAPAGEAVFFGRTFTFPDDYTLEVAAGPDVLARPIEADFDDRGRLYVTESSGSNEPVRTQLEKKPHKLWRLEDADGDGVFEKRVLFADGLMLPQGVLWHGGSVYVAAPPQIWKFTDTDDDGKADLREVWHDGGTLTGCANDLHGPYAGPDGLIYWCKGAFAEQSVNLPRRENFPSTAAHVWRARPDGSGKEIVFTAGMDNPVGLAWTPEGDLIVSGTFLQHPGGGKRDGLIHAARGGVWGKEHGVLDGHVRTGPLLPAMTHLGPAAPAGACRYGRDLLVCQFNMRKVSRHALHPDGGTWRTEDSDFLVCDHPDFHPTDVLQAPDGSVLVVDTGGWYKLCCPTSQLAKPDVPGAIFRLRRKGGEIPAACPPSRWTLENSNDGEALRRDLKSPNLHLRRKAAEALAVWAKNAPAGGERAAEMLLEALALPDNDRFTEHALLYAAIEAADARAMRAGLRSEAPALRRATLYFFSQTEPGLVEADRVMAFLTSPDESVREAAVFAVRRVPEWRPAAVEAIRRGLREAGGAERLRAAVRAVNDGRLLDDLATFLNDETPVEARRSVLELMREIAAERKATRPAWREALLRAVAGSPEVAAEAAAVLAAGGTGDDEAAAVRALELSRRADLNAETALRLLTAAGAGRLTASDVDRLLSWAVGGVATESRRAIFALLRNGALSAEQHRRAAELLPKCGPLEWPLLLPVFKKCQDEAAGLALLDAMEKAGASRVVSPEVLEESFAAFPETVKRRLETLRTALAPTAEADRIRVEELEKSLPPGDAARGSLVFQSARASCAQCHQIGYKGGTLGPDLSRIGAVRSRRDLIEAVVAPSASFVRSYEPVMIERKDGGVAYGIVTEQNSGGLTLATGAGAEPVTLKADEIQSMTPGEVSLMPAGLDRILTPEELADLIAFLESMK